MPVRLTVAPVTTGLATRAPVFPGAPGMANGFSCSPGCPGANGAPAAPVIAAAERTDVITNWAASARRLGIVYCTAKPVMRSG